MTPSGKRTPLPAVHSTVFETQEKIATRTARFDFYITAKRRLTPRRTWKTHSLCRRGIRCTLLEMPALSAAKKRLRTGKYPKRAIETSLVDTMTRTVEPEALVLGFLGRARAPIWRAFLRVTAPTPLTLLSKTGGRTVSPEYTQACGRSGRSCALPVPTMATPRLCTNLETQSAKGSLYCGMHGSLRRCQIALLDFSRGIDDHGTPRHDTFQKPAAEDLQSSPCPRSVAGRKDSRKLSEVPGAPLRPGDRRAQP